MLRGSHIIFKFCRMDIMSFYMIHVLFIYVILKYSFFNKVSLEIKFLANSSNVHKIKRKY